MSKKEGEISFVKWFSELDKESIPIAGGKGANLSEIFNLKVPVPPGFVVTAQAYRCFIDEAGIDRKIRELLAPIDYENTKQLDETTSKIRALITNSSLPKEMEQEIIEAYDALGTEHENVQRGLAHDILKNASEPTFVAVRSSATTEDLAEASFAGQQDSFLNVKGRTSLITHIKKCIASLFTSRATYYRNKQGFKYDQASLAVVVQKMVDSDKSGVMFSKDPTSKNDNIIIEAVWGLGEGIVSGQITPDSYIVSSELKILNKKIALKKIAVTRDSGGGKTVVKLTEERSKQQVLKEHEIKQLAEMALKLEEHYGKPQDIEFAIENNDLYIVQTRPITTLNKTAHEEKQLKGEIILEGLAASPGIGVGIVKIVNSTEDLQKIKKGDILVTTMTNPDMVVTMQKASAIVTDEGGQTAHAAIVSREMGIPAVVGTQEATKKLVDGELITVDGSTGKIYRGKVSESQQKEVLPIEAQTKTQIKVIVDLPSFAERAAKSKATKVGLTRIEGIIAESGKHPNYFLRTGKIKDYEEVIFKGVHGIAKHFEEIWVRTSDIRTDEYQHLEGAPKEIEANPMLGFHGIRYSLKNPEILKAELNALKRVANEGKSIGVLLPQVILLEEVKEVKKMLKSMGFHEAKIGVMIETPAAVQIIKSLCEDGIDFVSFGTNDLTQYMLAIDRGNEKVQYLYNEMHPSILYQLEYVIRVCKRNNVESSICGQSGSKKEMVKFLIEKGIDSISVNADKAKEISDYVAELEKNMLQNTDSEPRHYEKKRREEEKRSYQEETGSEEYDNSPEVYHKEIDESQKKEEPIYSQSLSKKEKEKMEEEIEAIEGEKEEYIQAHPKEEFDEKPEFESEEELSENIEKEFEDIFR